MSNEGVYAGNLRLVGGMLCLDFVNTVDWRTGKAPQEWLNNYDDLAAWGRHVGILSDNQRQTLVTESQQKHQVAYHIVGSATALRETLYRLIVAPIHNQEVSSDDMVHFNTELKQAAANLELVQTDTGYEWAFPLELDCIVWPVVWSAATLLTSDLLHSIKMCEGHGCGWLFLDTSPNQRRRWCSMETCGNRAKARRHYKKSTSDNT